jgi:hypothetical protein
MPYMKVSYIQDSTSLGNIRELEFQTVRRKSNVIFNEGRNNHAYFLPVDQTGIVELPEESEYFC